MTKIHTRAKRKRGVPSHRSYSKISLMPKKIGEKTFKTEESANNWAKENGFKEGSFNLVKVKKNKKFAVRKKE